MSVKILMHERCEVCKFFMPENEQMGYCRRFPAQVGFIPSQNRLTGQFELQTQSSFPPVQNGAWCGEFSAQPEIVG